MASKVWLITGCSSPQGFGTALAEELLTRGQKVIATGRNRSSPVLGALKEKGASVLALDVTSPFHQIRDTIEEANKIYGGIGFLINNAGFNQTGTIEEMNLDKIEAQFQTNVFGVIKVIKSVLPQMRERRSGCIVNISSTVAWQGGPTMGAYMGSKAALSQLSEALAAEVAELGIKVCCIEPGAYRSGLLQADKIEKSKQGEIRIRDYDATASRQLENIISMVDGNQPGDPAKGARVIVDVLLDKWNKGIPLRLVIGKDGHDAVKAKLDQVSANLKDWEGVATATDFGP
ncbi:hypothetical protein PV08_11026 [Exophiala spinifera]|uniref:Uncharacterized protein n=1 Tax=Exophiala spinifera TaxID=91928 RepID=A0A0D2BKB6_9EURO|nr:uncharacterized protein PV08_11026 [Exophiala spinifera]KIW11724.1 hypothetical protein PV08_11026 [Exophiala spinifera]